MNTRSDTVSVLTLGIFHHKIVYGQGVQVDQVHIVLAIGYLSSSCFAQSLVDAILEIQNCLANMRILQLARISTYLVFFEREFSMRTNLDE